MSIDLKEFRKRLHFTQAEMAVELGLKTGTYAMMERGDRKMPHKVRKTLDVLRRNLSATSMDKGMKAYSQSGDVAAILEKSRMSEENAHEQAAYCMMEMVDLQKKLRVMKLKFNEAIDFVTTADVQLLAMEGDPSKKDMIFILRHKRLKAMKLLGSIVEQNPTRMMVKVNLLRQQKLVFDNAASTGGLTWLDANEKELTPGA